MTTIGWIVLWPCEGFSGGLPTGLRPWPPAVESLVSRRYDKKAGGFWFPSKDAETARVVADAFRAAYGSAPVSFRVGQHSKERENEHPFYLLNVGDETVELADGEVFENQASCGNPPPNVLRIGGNGCGQNKRQLHDLWVSNKHKQPRKDLFRIVAGPRLPYSRVYGVNARLRDALIKEGITGCELRPILDASRTRESGMFQLTVTGSTRGVLAVDGNLIRPLPCNVCGFVVGGLPGLPPTMRSYPRDYFADIDLQVGDRWLVGDAVVNCGDIPPLFASSRFMRLLQEQRFTGWNKAADHTEFWPVTIG